MAPRGLKALLKTTSPCKLVATGRRGQKAFVINLPGVRRRRHLSGLTKMLEKRIFSKGRLPISATHGPVRRRGRAWTGADGGRRRGVAVDAQLTRAANRGAAAPNRGRIGLTNVALAALQEHGLEPLLGQRAVCDERRGIATAADIVCWRQADSALIVVEVKTGYSGAKTAATRDERGRGMKMRGPLGKASDCVLHRHLAQLAVTREMLANEPTTMARLKEVTGAEVANVGGTLLYVDDKKAEMYELPRWWQERAGRALAALAA